MNTYDYTIKSRGAIEKVEESYINLDALNAIDLLNRNMMQEISISIP